MKPPITAILLNYKRRANLQRILDRLSETKLIGEVLVWNNDPEVSLTGAGDIRMLNSSHNYRAYARYAAAFLARGDTILFQDDDWLFPAANIVALHEEYLRDPSRIYGFTGRNLVDARYSMDMAFGEVDIVVGQFMLFSKQLLASVYGDILRLTPFERGDDIAFSLLTGVKHICRRSRRTNLGSGESHALWTDSGHLAKRQQMVERVLAMRSGAGADEAPPQSPLNRERRA